MTNTETTGRQAETSRPRRLKRTYKDQVFSDLFSDPKNALSLYNAVTGSNHSDPDALEIVTLEDMVYMRAINDLAVCVGDTLALFEHQSTPNPNMPLRGLIYFAGEYRKIMGSESAVMFSRRLRRIPAPLFFVLYNGREDMPEESTLLLSDAFERPVEGYEWTAHVLNVNAGHGAGIMARCPILSEYAELVRLVREFGDGGLAAHAAVDAAVAECLRRGILGEYLRERGEKAIKMLYDGYDEELEKRVMEDDFRSEGYAEGRAEGLAEGREAGLAEGLAEGREAGLAEGLAEGREAGLAEGQEAGRKRASQLVGAMVAAGVPVEEALAAAESDDFEAYYARYCS